MKKNDWIIIVAVATYSYLFYEQTPGINYLLFNLVLITLLFIKYKTLYQKPYWILATIGALLSATSVALYSNTLSIIANGIALCVLSSLSYNSNTSIVFSLIYSIYSGIAAPVNIIIDAGIRKANNTSQTTNNLLKKALLVIIPLAITVLFFIMYRASNPLFDVLASKLNFNFISITWILFTLLGTVIMYAFLFPKQIDDMFLFEQNATNNLHPTYSTTSTILGKTITLIDENFSGIVLFTLLNLLLLIVNMLDINFHCSGGALPQGITHSEFVHQGIGTLILSIIFAIIIILFYFRGELNFNANNKTLKYLAYLWVLQNVFMLISTVLKNDLYITEYGLTYKRIGVYVYLFLCSLGLITTLIKIGKSQK